MRKSIAFGLFALAIALPATALAHNRYDNGHNHHQHGQGSQSSSQGSSGSSSGGSSSSSSGSNSGSGSSVTPTPPVVSGSEIILSNVYTTAYGWPDNTPAGCAISNGVLHGDCAGGQGTYQDPITLAVGHSISGGADVLDYPAGTRFYDPDLRKYFIVEDACGDGNTPQNGPCHEPEQGSIQLDMWVGGEGASQSAVLNCEEAVTRTGVMIENPPSNLAVVAGAIYNNGCAAQFGDAVVSL